MKTLNGQDVASMTEHWSETPANGYLGSSYGQNFNSFIQQPQTVVAASSFIQKLRDDVEIIKILPADTVNIYASESGPDTTDVVLTIAGRKFNLGEK